MNYKVKAHDLVNQYFSALVPGSDTDKFKTNEQLMIACKHCAIIAVNEIIDTLQPGEDDLLGDLIAYWQNVKKEIQKI